MPKATTDGKVETKTSEAAKELVGKYASDKNAARTIEVMETDGKVSLVVEGQPPYELREKSKDVFNSPILPTDYSIKAIRDASGKLVGIVLAQPEGEFSFNRIGKDSVTSNAPKMTVDELMPKVINALGVEANW